MQHYDYKRGKVYTIRSRVSDLVYVGSTINSLPKRLDWHKRNYKSYNKGTRKGRCTSYDLFDADGIENCYIELYENYPCNDKPELRRREGQVMRELDCVNKRIEGRTQKEYREDNKEKILEYNKQYYQDNKEIYNEKIECGCGGIYTYYHKLRHLRSKKHRKFVFEQHNIFNHL